MQFSENVRLAMAFRQLTMGDLHVRTGLDPRTIFKAIDDCHVSPNTRQTLADALGLPVETLEQWSGDSIRKIYTRWPRRRTMWTWLRKVAGL